MGMKRKLPLFIILLTAGCAAAPVAGNRTPPREAAAAESADPQARTDVSVKRAAAPERLSARVGETLPGKSLPPAAESALSSGKEAEASEPSPHDISLPMPEIEEGPLPPPTPPAEAPRAFLYDVPVVRNAIVDRWIEYFTGPGRASFVRWLGRSGRYIGLFREILKENGLPQDLAYLCLIESGFSLKARSRAGAVGPWQFMPGTARMMGLKINFYVDERRNPIKATRAASAYLSELYEEFGDWHLALAGYNAGERRVVRAMRRSGKKDYWSLARTRYLPNETRHYVGKYLAGMIIAKNPEVFGFVGIDYDAPWDYPAIALPHGISLRAIARASSVPLRTLRRINAELRTSVTPPGRGYRVFLPNEAAARFAGKLEKFPREHPSPNGHYRIRRGDTFGVIAQRFRIPLRRLMEANAHIHPRKLHVGARILLPASGKSREAAHRRKPAPPSKRAAPEAHVVRRGESLWHIARKYNVSTRQLVRLNPGLRPKRLRVGAKVRLPSPERLAKAKKTKEPGAARPSHHVVGPGESVSLIAQRYGIPTKSLLAWNRLAPSDKIFPGHKLKIRR